MKPTTVNIPEINETVNPFLQEAVSNPFEFGCCMGSKKCCKKYKRKGKFCGGCPKK